MYDIQHICDALDGTLNLRLVEGCFSIVRGADILAELCCFKGLVSPVDSYKRAQEVIPSHSSLVVFDNKFDISPDDTVAMQTRGWILYVSYPSVDDAGVEVFDEDLNVIARITNNEGVTFDIPFYLFFTLLSNPVTTDHSHLINKLEIINNNNYFVNVSVLLPIIHKDGVGLNSEYIPGGC